ncbi:hypothetical protein FB45DRAFT_919275 [Roridomyces roridus]|uniref:Uncharacterized protein n=1 Tax=Roridomyces roridus TaxID=1738132 RepID=A0AAD7BRQ5_9AGAR|nr:hypothetical protein FB45DRAFT_919275 [Roridomyces roridus]
MAVQGLLRDLNHRVPLFRSMAHVTLADWMCTVNNCRHPFDGSSQQHTFTRQVGNIPVGWIAAHDSLRVSRVSIRCTDLSYYYSGDVSLTHIHNAVPVHLRADITSAMVASATRSGAGRLSDVARWSSPGHSSPPEIPHLLPRRREDIFSKRFKGRSVYQNWRFLEKWLSSFSLQSLLEAVLGHRDHVAEVPGCFDAHGRQMLSNGLVRDAAALADLWTLAVPTLVRQQWAEDAVLALCVPHVLVPVTDLVSSAVSARHVAASDGSQVPADARFRQRRSATFASVSPIGVVQGGLDLMGSSAGIAAAEVYGLVAAALLLQQVATAPTSPSRLAPSHPSAPSSSSSVQTTNYENTIFTDHLNSIRTIHTSIHAPFPAHQWDALPNRSLYRWLRHLLLQPYAPSLIYVKAHTQNLDIATKLNDCVDRLASSSHYGTLRPPPVPVPTFFMDHFTLHSPSDRYVDTSLPQYLENALRANWTLPPPLATLTLYADHSVPSHPYLRSPSAFSALSQLYIRSSQLATAVTMHRRRLLPDSSCRRGCPDAETEHHIFVRCPAFINLRDEAREAVVRDTITFLNDADVPLMDVRRVKRVAECLFRDHHRIWPQNLSKYFLGLVPLVPAINIHPNAAARKVSMAVGQIWHSAGIKLTARIWAEVLRWNRRGEKRRGDDVHRETVKRIKASLPSFDIDES